MPPTLQASLNNGGIGVLILALCAVGVYSLARWVSGLGHRNVSGPTPDVPLSFPEHSRAAAARDPQDVLVSFPMDPSLGRIRITNFFFKTVDAIAGPPDRLVFADELLVELYDPDTDHKWWQSYFVATPQGLAQILRDKSWKYLYAAEMLVVPRYDVQDIRRAVVSRIVEDNELFKPNSGHEESV